MLLKLLSKTLYSPESNRLLIPELSLIDKFSRFTLVNDGSVSKLIETLSNEKLSIRLIGTHKTEC